MEICEHIISEDRDPALLRAAAEDHAECVDILVIAGADVNYRDKDGNTPLIISAKQGNSWSVKTLLIKHVPM